MTDWRYWITYTGTFSHSTKDEDVALLAAVEQHQEAIHNEANIYMPEVEVEEVNAREGDV